VRDVELDSRNVGVKRWRTRALDRTQRSSVVREDKAKLKGEGERGEKEDVHSFFCSNEQSL
jgi:hypothetical protein